MSCSAVVMNRLTPSMCQVPSGCWIALVRPAPTSEPASGSVSTIVAPHRPLDHPLGDLALLLGAEAVDDVRERSSPEAYMCTAGLEPSTSSATAHRRLGGTTVPPSSSGRSIRHHSASM